MIPNFNDISSLSSLEPSEPMTPKCLVRLIGRGRCMKPVGGWDNAATIGALNLGVMVKEFRKKHFNHQAKSARVYKTRTGKTGYHGTRFLKGTQTLGEG